MTTHQWPRFVCPSCRSPLGRTELGWNCSKEHLEFTVQNGIPDFLLPSRRPDIEHFLQYYNAVRAAEFWGSDDINFYSKLPSVAKKNKHSSVWKVRAKTFQSFREDITRDYPAERSHALDVGSGNCWLAYQLSMLGYKTTAVDINLDKSDGLGVGQRLMRAHSTELSFVRAEFDSLPFADSTFDIIVFNASLHYSRSPTLTIRTTLPLLTPGGAIYVLDSPMYRSEASGDAMVRDRFEAYRNKFGLSIPPHASRTFLTFAQIDELSSFAGVTMLRPDYGLFWIARNAIATLLHGREAATFFILKIKPKKNATQ